MAKHSTAMKLAAPRATRTVRVTLGDLLTAAYDATGGKAEGVAQLLEQGPLAEMTGKRLKFV
jgi:hypothetical protein